MKILLLFLVSINLYAVEEENFQLMYLEYFSGQNYEMRTLKGRKGHNVDYMKYGIDDGDRGAVVISVGRNEAAIKYLEVAYDLFQKGFSPIYVTSHRGQGFSDRVLKNPDKGYVRKFYYYTQDLKKLYKIVKSEINPNAKIYLIGHSMGGAIATEYMQKYPFDFSKAVLTSPMHKILLANGESDALKQTWLACYIPFKPYCVSYVPDGGDANPSPKLEESDVTTSRNRFDWGQFLFTQDERTRLGDATIRWVRQSVLANRNMRKQKQVNKIKIPFLILQAGNDKVVDNSGMNSVCAKSQNCTMIRVENSKHNILMEQDQFRNQAMNAIDSFFNDTTIY